MRMRYNVWYEAGKGICTASALAKLLAVCSMQKAVSVVKKTNAYWRALETGARKNTEDKVLARKRQCHSEIRCHQDSTMRYWLLT